MSLLLENATISEARTPTDAELIKEAKAWGYESWDAYCKAQAEACDEAIEALQKRA